MRKILSLLLVILIFASGAMAQSFFKPLPKPKFDKFSLSATDSSNLTQNAIRPVVAISAITSTGESLGAGAGAGFEHLRWDVASQSWVTVYSISALAFIATNGTKITGTGGLVFGIPGTNGLVAAGVGYDFSNKVVVLLTGVNLQFH